MQCRPIDLYHSIVSRPIILNHQARTPGANQFYMALEVHICVGTWAGGSKSAVSVCNLSFYDASSLQKLDKRLVNSFPVILLGQDQVFTESGSLEQQEVWPFTYTLAGSRVWNLWYLGLLRRLELRLYFLSFQYLFKQQFLVGCFVCISLSGNL